MQDILAAPGFCGRRVRGPVSAWLNKRFSFASASALFRRPVGGVPGKAQLRGPACEAVAVIGAPDGLARLLSPLSSEAKIVRICNIQATPRLGEDEFARLFELWRAGRMDSVVIAHDGHEACDIAELANRLKRLPFKVSVTLDPGAAQAPPGEVQLVGGIPVAVIADRAISRHGLLIKTCLDKAGAVLLLLLLAPLLLSIALAISCTSPGGIIFRQARQGWCGRRFTIYKFRTMRAPPDGTQWLFQTERHDARCTRIGEFLRRTSLDELPQLWNVLRGDMSLVGPRPHAEQLHGIDPAQQEFIAVYAQRSRVRPGMTGWAQIHGVRGAADTLEQLRRRVAYDLFYIEHWSLWLDMRILARTAFCLFGENAY